MKRGYLYLIAFTILVIAFLIYVGGFEFSVPIIQPPPPGEYKPVTVVTEVTVSNWGLAPPIIREVKSTIGGTATSTYNYDLKWLTFEGKLEVKVVYPEGQTIVVGTKNIKMGWFEVKKYSFVWVTKQAGTHKVIVTLYDKDGSILDEKTEEITVPPR